MKIGILGATGLVGRMMLKVIDEKNIDFDELFLFASEKSEGEIINFNGKEIPVMNIRDDWYKDIDYALFAVDENLSKELAEEGRKHTVIIDNSSAFRLDDSVPLIVPEINLEKLKEHNNIIANPNCSTIQLVLPLKALMKYGIESVFVSTYQSVSGAGKDGIEELFYEMEYVVLSQEPPYEDDSPFSDIIANNLIPEIGPVKDGYCKEEWKLIKETRKILEDDFTIFPSTVRVPVLVGHSQAVSVVFKEEIPLDEIVDTLENFPGIKIQDRPTPRVVKNSDDIVVGRLRIHPENKKVLQFFSVMNNLRKGAATNAVQILQSLLESAGN